MAATGNIEGNSGAGQVSSNGQPAGEFAVWVELRCSRCPEQIAGQHIEGGPVPHAWLARAARATGAVRLGRHWVCFSCVRDAARKKRAEGLRPSNQVLALHR